MTGLQNIIIGKKFKETQIPSESIYNLIPGYTDTRKRSPRYQSKYNNLTKKLYESNKKSHETMGHAKTPLNPPEQYLKKHTREFSTKIESKHFSCLDREHKKPAVPKRDEFPVILHGGGRKNFIHLNKLNVLRKPALKPARKMVDNRKGDSFFLEFSGLVPKFSMKEEFGKTPRYLVQRRRDIDYSSEIYETSLSNTKMTKLSDEERMHLLEGLRANWEEFYNRYMSLPLVIDTKILKMRKLDLEKKLDLLEHDIYFLERNEDNDIYVVT